MNAFKRLVREIHRRSLWQVLGLYLGGSWVVLEVVDSLTETAGLPAWFPSFALALLLIGLPVVLATAFVQEGGPGGGEGVAGEVPDEPAGPRADTGPIDGSASPGRGPGRLSAFFTWRNAIAGGVLAFALWGVVATAWLLSGGGVGPDRGRDVERPSIAVLPFTDMSPDGDQEYFSDGIAEEILNALARLPSLDVAARTSAFSFKGRAADIRDVGRELGVNHVLEGSVRKSGNRVRITAQLIEVDDGFHRWSDSYDRELTDVFAVQDEIARAIVDALEVTLTDAPDRPLVERGTANPDAHDAYLRGRYHWNRRDAAGLRTAVEHFRRSIARDSAYAAAWAGLADSYALLPWYSSDVDGRELLPRAREAAERALELDPDLAEAHTSLGWVRMFMDHDWAGAEEAFLRAIATRPGYGTAHHWYSMLLSITGRHGEALARAREGVAIDPLSLVMITNLGNQLRYFDQYDEASEQYRRALEMEPEYAIAWLRLGETLLLTGSFEEAGDALATWAELVGAEPEAVRTYARAIQAHAATGRPAELSADLAARARLTPPRAARYHAMAGDVEGALNRLEQSLRERSPEVVYVAVDQAFDALREEERFRRLLDELGLEPPEAR